MQLKSALALCFVIAPLGLFAQAPAKPATTPVANAETREKNIQEYIALLRTDVRAQKTQIMGVMMSLNADESAKFWPIYKDFEAELSGFYDGILGLIQQYAQNYTSMTPAVADQIATKMMQLETQRQNLKPKYYQRFKTSMDAITATRFLQVENQLERLIDLEISSNLPVIE